MEIGKVSEVHIVPSGDELIQDHSSGATTLYVDDISDFSDDGGQLQLGGIVYSYTTIDDDLSTITLATGLSVGVTLSGDADVKVFVYPLSDEKWATVTIDGRDEAELVRIPHYLYDMFALGVREDEDQENVEILLEGTEWYLYDIVSKVPSIDGAYINPATLPTPAIILPDGVVPATPINVAVDSLGIGALRVTWQAVTTNASAAAQNTPVSYQVHISITTGFTPDSTTLLTTVASSNAITVSRMPNGDALLYPTIYYIKVIASDADGLSAASAEASGSPRQITDGDISAESVYAMRVSANSIEAGTIGADILMAGNFTTATGGQRVQINSADGLQCVYPDGVTPRVWLPTGADKPAIIRGEVTADVLTVAGDTQLNDTRLSQGSDLILESGVSSPTTPPSVSYSYQGQVTAVDDISPAAKRWGLAWYASKWWMAIDLDPGVQLRSFDPTTGAVVDTITCVANTTVNPIGGLTRLGSTWWVLCQNTVNKSWYMRGFSDTGVQTAQWAYTLYPSSTTTPGIGNDGTNLLVGRCTAGGVGWVDKFNPATGVWISGVQDSVNPGNVDVAGVWYNCDTVNLGANRYVLFFDDNTAQTHVLSSTGVFQNTGWSQGGVGSHGFAWDGTRWANIRNASVYIRFYTDLNATVTTDLNLTITVSAAWYSTLTLSDGQSLHETGRSKDVSLTFPKRATWSASMAPNPPTNVNACRFYLSASWSGGSQARQQLVTQPPDGTYVLSLQKTIATAVVSKAIDFPAAVAARVLQGSTEMGLFTTGDVKMVAYACAPSPTLIDAGGAWLLCDGGSFSSVDYPALAGKLGDSHGVHSGSTYFLPDYRRRMPRGADMTGGTNWAVGANEGSASLAARTMTHNHTVPASNLQHDHNVSGVTSTTAGSAHTHGIAGQAAGTAVTVAQGGSSGYVRSQDYTGHAHGQATDNQGSTHTHGINGSTGLNQSNADSMVAHNHGGNTGTNLAADLPWMLVNFLIKV